MREIENDFTIRFRAFVLLCFVYLFRFKGISTFSFQLKGAVWTEILGILASLLSGNVNETLQKASPCVTASFESLCLFVQRAVRNRERKLKRNLKRVTESVYFTCAWAPIGIQPVASEFAQFLTVLNVMKCADFGCLVLKG